ncbi:MAG: formylglycine-generating enzyme family protein [Opitutaceae bacterium]|jgi:tetratricopeptide (TPR) repeat protein|nr:formylglycine-generating enzyme family protein [Opitutaceae bacterium]
MPRFRFRRRLATIWQKLYKVLLAALGLAMLGTLYYVLANLGPGKLDDPATSQLIDDPAVIALIRQVDDLEKQYRQVADAGVFTPEALQALEKAVAIQRDIVRRLPLSSYEQANRLRDLESRFDSARARDIVGRIGQLEKEGDTAAARGDIARAKADYEEALRLQREINVTSASTEYKNYMREATLSQSLSSVDAAPLNHQKEAALTAARNALAEKRWRDAIAAFTTARDLQVRINGEYPRTRFVDVQGVDKIDAEIETLNAADAADEIEKHITAAEHADLIADYDEAARLYTRAAAIQREINTTFPRSRFVSSARVDELEIRSQTTHSRMLGHKLEALDKQIGLALSRRHVVAAELDIPAAVALLEKIETDFPRSRLNSGIRKIRLSWLNLKKTDIGPLQDDIYAHIALIPDLPEIQTSAIEVTQSLYKRIMNTNPSRNPGDAHPVESVTWNEAGEFCNRLGWLLGAPVRLPTEAEYRAAIKGGAGGVQSADNGAAQTREAGALAPNQFGIHDLLGNVAEWLQDVDDTRDTRVTGGSYLDQADRLTELTIVKQSRNDRARHIGFRFVIERPALVTAEK